MNKKLFYIFAWGFMSLMAFGGFNNAVEYMWGDPIIRPWGTTTSLKDSTNYVSLNKGLYVRDSIKTNKDLIVKGSVRLDTLGQVAMQLSGNDFTIYNNKENGDISNWIGEKNSFFYWYKSSGGIGINLMQLDTINGLTLNGYNLQTSSTGQIKLPSDTATDYNSDDAITLNRQSGKITTKSLTTAADNFYTVTLTNSLISATSKVWVMYSGGTTSAGRPLVYSAIAGSGSVPIIILNLTGAGAFNGTIKLDYVIWN